MKGSSTSPAGNHHLLAVNPTRAKLDKDTITIFLHLTAKIYYLAKRAQSDLLPTAAFLSTWGLTPDHDD
jgi:hypothetical protein